MNLRRKTPSDSLYLLLDTLCNAFGGIILLAVLVVLLTSKEKSQHSTSSDSQEMLQRRLALAQTNLQQSLQLASSLSAKANDPRWKQQMLLLSTRKNLQDAIQQSRDAVAQDSKELDAANSADPSERLKSLNAELAAAQAHKLAATNSLAAANENIKRLKQRLADMEGQVAVKLNQLQRPLRLPREHETGQRVVWIIARYGHIYSCRNADLSRNETDIIWTADLYGEKAEPIRGRGIDPMQNPGELSNFFDQQSSAGIYLAFNVFEDSFPAFIQAKEIAVKKGFTYALDFQRVEDGPLRFTHGPGYNAIDAVANILVREAQSQAFLKKYFGSDVTLIPIPRSAPLAAKDALWPTHRICRALVACKFGGDIAPVLERHRPVQKSSLAKPGMRPGPQEHYDSTGISQGNVILSGRRITLVDDVITRGASFVGMMPHLQRAFPGYEINCFALVRTQSYDAVDQIVAAVEGVITYDGWQLRRVP